MFRVKKKKVVSLPPRDFVTGGNRYGRLNLQDALRTYVCTRIIIIINKIFVVDSEREREREKEGYKERTRVRVNERRERERVVNS